MRRPAPLVLNLGRRARDDHDAAFRVNLDTADRHAGALHDFEGAREVGLPKQGAPAHGVLAGRCRSSYFSRTAAFKSFATSWPWCLAAAGVVAWLAIS